MKKKKSGSKTPLGRDPFEGMDVTWIDGPEETVDPWLEQEDSKEDQKDAQSDVSEEQGIAERTLTAERTEVEGGETAEPIAEPEEIDFTQLLDEPADVLQIDAGPPDQSSTLSEELTSVSDREVQPVSDLSAAADVESVILPGDADEREDLTLGSRGGAMAQEDVLEESLSEADPDLAVADFEPRSQVQSMKIDTPVDPTSPAEETDPAQMLQTSNDILEEDTVPHEQPTPPLEELIDQINREVDQSSDLQEVATEESLDQRLEVRDQYIRFLLDDILLALPLSSALEVGQHPAITPMPNLPDWVLGVSNLRGEIISVVDLKMFFERPSEGLKKQSRLIVVHSEEMKVGLIVDRIMGILSLDQVDTSIQQSPYKKEGISTFISGVAMTEDKLLNILDVDKLFSSLRQAA
jgi:purine-binding chemotaxis protein CheW